MTTPVRERNSAVEAQVVREIIGRVGQGINIWASRSTSSVDTTIPDYSYWDRVRRGLVDGLRLAGAFAKPAAEIKSDWIMGDGFSAELAVEKDAPENANVAYTNTLLSHFATRIKATMLQITNDLKTIGDQYMIVNGDGSISVPSPETVKFEYDPLDYRRPLRATVTTKTAKMTVTDQYRLDGRTLTIETSDQILLSDLRADGYVDAGANRVKKDFENLIGRLPVIHFANDRSANETHGRPMVEALLHLWSRYDALLEKAMDAAEIMSNPIPVFTVEDIDASLGENDNPSPETWYETNGTGRTRNQVEFDRFATIFLRVLADGTKEEFNLVSPDAGYTNDIKAMLKLLFLLTLEHLRIPEVIWGGELGQARASASEQMKTFYMHIAGERLRLEGEAGDELLMAEANGGIHELMDVWLRTRALIDRRVVIMPVRINWPALGEANDEMNLKWAESLKKNNTITDETFAELSGRIEDPEGEVAAAKKQALEGQDTFDAAVDAAAARAQPNPDAAGDGQLGNVA